LMEKQVESGEMSVIRTLTDDTYIATVIFSRLDVFASIYIGYDNERKIEICCIGVGNNDKGHSTDLSPILSGKYLVDIVNKLEIIPYNDGDPSVIAIYKNGKEIQENDFGIMYYFPKGAIQGGTVKVSKD